MKKMWKRITAVLLVVVILGCASPFDTLIGANTLPLSICATAAQIGTCGDNVTWEFDGTHLIISGFGSMNDYSTSNTTPWDLWELSISGVIINEGVTSVGAYAFSGCKNLLTVELPRSINTISKLAFYGCKSLTQIIIPDNVVSIGEMAFSDSGLLEVIIPPSTASIGSSAFSGCSSLTSAVVYGRLLKMDYFIFQGCTNLERVRISDGAEEIGSGAFQGCTLLRSVVIPQSVKTIGNYAFRNCNSLQSVSFYNTLKNVSMYAFFGCTSLSDVFFTGGENEWKDITVGDNNDCLTSATVHYNSPDIFQKYKVGDVIEYGKYPQSKITDATLITTLSKLIDTWYSYDYYVGTGELNDGQMHASDYMKYTDVYYNGQKYRGVFFSQYRPYYTGYTSSADYSVQDENGYQPNTIYWFRWESLRWRVLDPSSGLVLCDTIIDSQPFNNYVVYDNGRYWVDPAKSVYANNYPKSSIYNWLAQEANSTSFLNVAFTKAEREGIIPTVLDNSAYSASYSEYSCNSTIDKIFLPSWNDVQNPIYQFPNTTSPDVSRKAQGSDYAKCQGLDINRVHNCSDWQLRSASFHSNGICGVLSNGEVYNSCFVDRTLDGVRPAMCIDFSTIEADQNDIPSIYGNETISLSGTISQEDYYINSSNYGTAYILTLDNPVTYCLYDDLMGYQGNQVEVSSIQVDENAKNYLGQHLYVTGSVLIGHNAHHIRTLVLSNCFYQTGDSRIKVYCTHDDLSVCTGESMSMAFALYKNNSEMAEWKKLSIVIGNPSVISVSDYLPLSIFNASNKGLYVNITGLSSGTSSITISDSDSGAYIILSINVFASIIGANSFKLDTVPEFYPDVICERNILTNFYNKSGLYVNNYQYTQNGSNGDYNVSFDVYNSKYYCAAVDVYDENGRWVDSVAVEKKTDISSIWDTGEAFYYLVADTVSGHALAYTAHSYSKKTHIDIQVPKGGYFTVSNNAINCPGVYFYNCIDMLCSAINGLSSYLIDHEIPFSTWSKGWEDKIFADLDFAELYMKHLLELTQKLGQNVIKSGYRDAVQHSTEAFEDDFNVVFGTDFKSVAKSLTKGAESIFEALTGPVGAALKTCFSISKNLDLLTQAMEFGYSYDNQVVSIHNKNIYYNNRTHVYNGVTVNDSYNSIDRDAVLQVFKVHVQKSDTITVMLNEQYDYDDYEVYNICFVKNESEVQPNGKVTVQIPIPYGMNKDTCDVLRRESNGQWTQLNATIQGNYLVFETDHFSYYAVAGSIAKSITIKQLPIQTSYVVGDILNVNGLTAEVIFENGKRTTVSSDQLLYSNTELWKAGKITITSTYGNVSTTFDVTVSAQSTSIPVTGVTVNPASVSLKIGDILQLTATVTPTSAMNKAVTWSSSNPNVASISNAGLVTAKAVGKATITVRTNDGGKTATCDVTVSSPDARPTGWVSNEIITLRKGETKTLTYFISCDKDAAFWYTYEDDGSSNLTFNTTAMSLTITANSLGRKVYYLGARIGTTEYYKLCSFTVDVVEPGITIQEHDVRIECKDRQTLHAIAYDAHMREQSVTWSSSNNSIARVDSNGTVYAVKKGVATITATAADGKIATCTVNVYYTWWQWLIIIFLLGFIWY